MIPRLSIIIPVRNGIDFAARAIESARAVPIDPLEIVVVDDGSMDGTSDLLAGLAQADPRIVVIHRDRDHGASAARNAGISRAGAAIVCFLDADDLLYPEPIAERLRHHEAHGDVVLSFANYRTLLPDGTIESRFASYWPRFERHVGERDGLVDLGASAFSLLYGENPVCTSGTMVRRETLAAPRRVLTRAAPGRGLGDVDSPVARRQGRLLDARRGPAHRAPGIAQHGRGRPDTPCRDGGPAVIAPMPCVISRWRHWRPSPLSRSHRRKVPAWPIEASPRLPTALRASCCSRTGRASAHSPAPSRS